MMELFVILDLAMQKLILLEVPLQLVVVSYTTVKI